MNVFVKEMKKKVKKNNFNGFENEKFNKNDNIKKEFLEYLNKHFINSNISENDILNNDLYNKNNIFKFLKNNNILIKNRVLINYINNEIFEILSSISFDEISLEEKIISLKNINWEEFLKLEDYKDKKPIIYENFVECIKEELGLPYKNYKNDVYKKRDNFNINYKNRVVAKKFNIEILYDYSKEGNKLSVNNFILYFNRRLDYFYNLLKNRIDLDKVVSISKLNNFEKNEEVSIIGLVNEIRETRKGFLLYVEDKTGIIKCFVRKENNELKNILKEITLDEGVAITGKLGDNIIWTENIIIPTPINKYSSKNYDEEVYGLFISDIHFGSKLFIDDSFQKLINFINGETTNEVLNKISKKLKYIFIAGDIIEGVGVYPNQERDLRIKSSVAQYKEAVRWLSQIDEEKCIVIIPGNHDTCRLSEPQLKMPYDYAYPLYNLSNTIILSNPSYINILKKDNFEGYDIYLYHGGSVFYYGDQIQLLREKGGVKKPNEIIKYLLKKRHLAPSHGSTLYYPDTDEDPLVIKRLPDFFILGHTHKLEVSSYKNTYIFSCGCWVEMSEYQEKQGMFPDPAKAILVNFKNKKVNILNFN